MKKNILIIFVIFIIILVIVSVNYKNLQMRNKEILRFNKEYEFYNKEKLSGIDVTTIINKAISNNEKYEIPKNEEGLYILDEDYSIEIYITMIINKTTYRMERINSLGITSFVEYFGAVDFKCTNITYHENTGRIASMTFEATEY